MSSLLFSFIEQARRNAFLSSHGRDCQRAYQNTNSLETDHSSLLVKFRVFTASHLNSFRGRIFSVRGFRLVPRFSSREIAFEWFPSTSLVTGIVCFSFAGCAPLAFPHRIAISIRRRRRQRYRKICHRVRRAFFRLLFVYRKPPPLPLLWLLCNTNR